MSSLETIPKTWFPNEKYEFIITTLSWFFMQVIWKQFSSHRYQTCVCRRIILIRTCLSPIHHFSTSTQYTPPKTPQNRVWNFRIQWIYFTLQISQIVNYSKYLMQCISWWGILHWSQLTYHQMSLIKFHQNSQAVSTQLQVHNYSSFFWGIWNFQKIGGRANYTFKQYQIMLG